jgi:hypothetical protein
VTGATAQSKVYDGSTTAAITGATLSGVVGSDAVVLATATIGAFTSAGVGTNIAVTPSMTITGAAIGNYTLTQPTDLKANITAKELVVTGATAQSKVYDGASTVTITGATLSGVVGSDEVILATATSGTFAQVGVGTNIAVTPSMTLTGAASGNYTLTQPTDLKADITAKALTVTNPTISPVKVYDGNPTATVVSGTLSGVVPNDATNIVLGATASYHDAKAGTDKTITVKYSLSGSAAVNYIAPADYTLATGTISRKQLTISDPTVVTNKVVDGNSIAAISAVGSLSGVEAVDASNVTIAAAANYSDAIVGTGKTITVVYTLNGNAKDNYIAPVNYTITNAQISGTITLSPLAKPTPGCEGDYLDLDYSILTGTPTQYKITFDAATISAGIQNVGYTNLPATTTSGTLQIAIPKGTADGTYSGTLTVRNEFGLESAAYSFTFTINLSTDYMTTKFNQIILVDNSSNRFTAYQWYKNGVAVNDATKQFYNDPAGLVGAYAVQVTDANGLKIMSCEKTLNFVKAVKVSIYPNPVKSTQTCTVQVSGLSNKELETADLSVYTLQGICIYQSPKVEMFNYMRLPDVDGVYVGHIKTADGNEYLFKVIVIK